MFPPGDDEAVNALRLIAAGNDIRSAVRLFKAQDDDALTQVDQRRAAGDRLYAFRMGSMHLSEALDVLNCRVNHRFFMKRAWKWSAEAKQATRMKKELNRGSLARLVRVVRNHAVGHYDELVFQRALSMKFVAPGLVSFSEAADVRIHFDAADQVWLTMIAENLSTMYPGVPTLLATGQAMHDVARAQITILDLSYLMIRILYCERILGV